MGQAMGQSIALGESPTPIQVDPRYEVTEQGPRLEVLSNDGLLEADEDPGRSFTVY